VAKAPGTSKKSGNIYIGIGGWTFEPWRGVFYPEKLAQAKELSYAASKLTSIEINGTYYGSQKPESFRKWAREVPDGFVFSLKGPRFATNRRVLAEAGDSVKRFYDSGVLELGDRLGPVLWQFAPTKKFDGADSANSWSCCRASSTATRCATWSRCGTTVFAYPNSSRCCASSRRPWCSPSTANTRRLPTSSAISSMRDCRRAMTS